MSIDIQKQLAAGSLDDLFGWLHGDGVDQLYDASEAVAKTACFLVGTDAQGSPSEAALDAFRNIAKLNTVLAVFNLVRSHICVFDGSKEAPPHAG